MAPRNSLLRHCHITQLSGSALDLLGHLGQLLGLVVFQPHLAQLLPNSGLPYSGPDRRTAERPNKRQRNSGARPDKVYDRRVVQSCRVHFCNGSGYSRRQSVSQLKPSVRPSVSPLRVQTTFTFKRFRAYVNLVTTLPPSSRDRRCADRRGGPTGSNCQAETAANCFCLLFLPQLGQFPVSRLITTRTSSSSSLPAESRPDVLPPPNPVH